MVRLTSVRGAAMLAVMSASCGTPTTAPSRELPMNEFGAAGSAAVARAWDVIRFDPAMLEYPEGIAIDPRGRLFVGMTRWAEVREIEPDGSVRSFARLLPPDKVPIPPGAPGLLGLATTASGDVYAALVTFDPATHGVYRIDGRTGQAERLVGSEAICWPNAMAFDARGNLYVTESTRVPCQGDPALGSVWRFRPGGAAEPWVESVELAGTGELPIAAPVGANGIVFQPRTEGPGTLIVANTEKGSLVSIPILANGSAGPISTLARDPRILTVDGIVLGQHGAIYAMVIGQNRIVKVSPDGSAFDVVANGKPLDFPVNAVFGVHGSDRGRLFVVNFALPAFGGTEPGVVVIEP